MKVWKHTTDGGDEEGPGPVTGEGLGIEDDDANVAVWEFMGFL